MGLAVRARGLTKRFGGFVAVDGIDLDVPAGVTFGVLGPNGAGKTTTMRMLTCVLPPSSGELEVLGADVRSDRRAIKRRLGVAPQGMTLDSDLTAIENLQVHGRYHGLPRQTAWERAEELLEFAQLTERRDAGVRELSGGMQRRLLIARALVNDPELIVLDEPTTGLDPQARHLVWERLRSLRRHGKTLIITTHYMDEAARLCEELVVMDRGHVIARGTPLGLVAENVAPRVVELQGIGAETVDRVRTAVGGAARDVEWVGDRMLVYGNDSVELARRIRQDRVPHHTLLERDATLEDVFLRLTGHELVE